MKTPSTFWPTLRNELALFRYGYPGWSTALFLVFYTTAFVAIVFLFLYRFGDSIEGNNLAMLLETNILFIALAVFFLPLIFATFTSTVPAFAELLQAGDAALNKTTPLPPVALAQNMEFLFTRAMDRATLCRARTVAFFLLALLPFFLIVLIAPFTPDLRLNLNHIPSDQLAALTNRFAEAFPAIHPLVVNQQNRPNQFLVPHGAVAYAAWLAWIAALGLLLCRAFGTLVSRWIKTASWWRMTPLALPYLFIAKLLAMTAHLQEQGFLFFAIHWLPMIAALIALAFVVQLWSERGFRQMEIL